MNANPHLLSAFRKRRGRRAGSGLSLLLHLSYFINDKKTLNIIFFIFQINILAIRLENYPLYVHSVCLQYLCRLWRNEPWFLNHQVWTCPHCYCSEVAPPAEGWLQPCAPWTQKKTSLYWEAAMRDHEYSGISTAWMTRKLAVMQQNRYKSEMTG